MMKLGVGVLYNTLDRVRNWGLYPPGCTPPKMWRWSTTLGKSAHTV